ncbi:phospholipase D family protein [Rhodanobacter sp. OK091]|uniref:phospholipase D family protein n=1 Tax=Rhodanobacter sp. OK091 TaxID=1881037 RepID=UPI000934F82A|nr:phospholipase D family protein [Rhodanobacter sp. OK091]
MFYVDLVITALGEIPLELISSNKKLVNTLSRLIEDYTEIQFAVAWATSGNSVFELLQTHYGRISRAVIGTHFYQTHPDVLDAFHGLKEVRFVLQPSGVFHPKIFLFRNRDFWEALIGSANLTNGALGKNSETMLLVGGAIGEPNNLEHKMGRLIEEYWGDAKTIKKSEAKAYRQIWEQKRAMLDRLNGQYGSNRASRSPTESPVMSMAWRDYFKAVKADPYHGFENRCDILAIVRKAFAENDSFAEMDLAMRKTIAGLPNDEEDRWGWFGSMQGAGYYHQAVNNNNEHISRALDHIPRRGTVTRSQYESYIAEFIKAFPNGKHGVAIASRLIALKRPDQFICLDGKNQKALCDDFSIKQSGMNYERYWDEIIGRIMDTPWWNSERPKNKIEGAVWDGRAAMLDAIFYEE